jgi:23S rRNA (guanosine2251-2'-O)-methyltransferase
MLKPKAQRPSKVELVFGQHPLLEALNSGVPIDKVLIGRGSHAGTELSQRLRELNIPLQFVPREKLDWLANNQNHQGIIAYRSAVTFQNLEEVVQRAYEEGQDPLVVACDGITDVRNLGAIARSAEAFGATALVVPTKDSARLGGDAVKASSGALLHLSVCRTIHLQDSLRQMKMMGLRIVALTEKGAKPLNTKDLKGPLVLLLGAEDTGIRPEHLALADAQVRIPLRGKTGSLNVAVAAGIALSQVPSTQA